MPINIPQPAPTAPYDTVQDVLNLSRVRINDAIKSIGGEVLRDDLDFTQITANGAWRRFQSFLANMGFSRFRKRVILKGVPPVDSSDPTSECWIDWSSYFDGTSYYIPPDADVLPQDFILPLKLAERQSGTGGTFVPMCMSPDGFDGWRKRMWNGHWDWRDDKIYIPGSLYPMDIQIYYAAFLPDFKDIVDTPWYEQQVPIMRCISAFSNFLCYEFTKPRGDVDANAFLVEAQADAKMLYNVEVGMKERTSVSRRPYGRREGRYPGNIAGII